MTPKIVICSLVLNEMEHLPRLYEQHKDWPGMERWVFVEGADRVYADTNPDRVSELGLSVDGTPGFLYDLSKRDNRVQYIPHGMGFHRDPAQGKCALRNRYLRTADEVRPDFLVVVDADEFYPRNMQERINATMGRERDAWGWCFRHREIWYPPTLRDLDLSSARDKGIPAESAVHPFSQEVTGGFWDIPYARCWRWFEGLEYADNHNTPSAPGKVGALDRRLSRHDKTDGSPYFVHMAFASRLQDRAAKHRYYEARGESRDRKRKWYTESRAAYETWQPGDELPNGAKVVPYDGLIPECFQ